MSIIGKTKYSRTVRTAKRGDDGSFFVEWVQRHSPTPIAATINPEGVWLWGTGVPMVEVTNDGINGTLVPFLNWAYGEYMAEQEQEKTPMRLHCHNTTVSIPEQPEPEQPKRCQYGDSPNIPGATESIEWMREPSASQHLRKQACVAFDRQVAWVQRTTREWPICPISGEPVKLCWHWTKETTAGDRIKGTLQLYWLCLHCRKDV